MKPIEIAIIQSILDALDEVLGDTDPFLSEDMTDEEVRTEEPLFWAFRQLSGLINVKGGE